MVLEQLTLIRVGFFSDGVNLTPSLYFLLRVKSRFEHAVVLKRITDNLDKFNFFKINFQGKLCQFIHIEK